MASEAKLSSYVISLIKVNKTDIGTKICFLYKVWIFLFIFFGRGGKLSSLIENTRICIIIQDLWLQCFNMNIYEFNGGPI